MGLSGQCHAHDALSPGGRDPVPIVQVAGSAPGPVWSFAENLCLIQFGAGGGGGKAGGLRSSGQTAVWDSSDRQRIKYS